MAYEEMKLEGLFRTVEKPYGRWKNQRVQESEQKKKKAKEKKIFVPEKYQPLFRITEQGSENGEKWVSVKFAKNVSPEEWKSYPYYGTHTINFLS